MSQNLFQVFTANPITTNQGTDLMYFGRSPYGATDDTGMTYANFALQFGAPYTAAALTKTDDTNVTLTLGGTPATALLQATSLTLGWTGTLSGTRGGTGVNNGANTATFAGNLNFANSFTTSGNFAVTQTYTGITNVTFPTSGTLATTAQIPTPAALTKVDDTNVTLTLGGTPATALLQATSITAGWTGTLAETRGGTAQSTYTLGDTLYSSAANTLSKLAGNITTAKQYLSQTGTGVVSAAPVWATVAGGDITGAALTKTDDTNVTLTLGGTPTTALLRAASLTLGWTGQLSLTRGGTNASLTASNGGIFYSTATAGAILAGTATANQVLLSGATAAPAWSTATYPATTTINQLLYSSAANVIGGLATANSAALVTTSAGVPTFSSTMTNGQVIIGSTGATPTAATLTAGTGVTITNGAGSITINASGTGTWVNQNTSTVTMGSNTGYTINNGASLVTLTLPTTANQGDFIEINGSSSGGWKIAQAAGQQIFLGSQSTTSGTGGSLASTNLHDCIRLRSTAASGSTTWAVVSVIGNITVV